MEEPRYILSHNPAVADFPYEIEDIEEARIVARCPTVDDARLCRSLLIEEEEKYEPIPGVVYGTVRIQFPKHEARSFLRRIFNCWDSDSAEPDPNREHQESRES